MEANEWELSKENVQPLRQGRKMTSLTAGLQPQTEQVQRIKDERHVFETELRTYTGDDPLDIWYKYIRWAEQTFPKGGGDSNLTAIVERCLRQFNENLQYKNDERFVYVWMKMADFCNEPLDIYNFMYDQNIGCELSSFYIGWATLYEQLGNTKKADAIYVKGLSKNAQPYDTLQCRQEEFQKRVARMTVQGQEFSNPEEPSVPEMLAAQDTGSSQRQVLSQLRAKGKKHAAPVNRTGHAITGSAGVLAGARPKTSQQVPKGIQVYQDENQPGSMLPPQTNEWKTLPKRDETNKENEKKAGVWNKQKLGKLGVNIPLSAVGSYRQPAYTVHVDEEADQSMRTPIKRPEISQPVLSARKEKAYSTIDYLRNMTANPNKSENPMYCKNKVYGGVEEFSFEELRAYKWRKNQEHIIQNQLWEDHRKKLEEARSLLLEEKEKINKERLRLQQEEVAFREGIEKTIIEQRLQMEQERQEALDRHKREIERAISQRMEEMMSMSSSFSKRGPQVDKGNTDNMAPDKTDRLHTSQNQQDMLNMSDRTPNNSTRQASNASSGERTEQVMFGSASPTVNTKEALMVVRGMFNSSLERHRALIEEEEEMEQQDSQPNLHAGQGNNAPFQVFDENQTTSGHQNQQSAGVPFEIFHESSGLGEKNVQKNTAPFAIFDENADPCQAQKILAVPFTVFEEKTLNTQSPSKEVNAPMMTSPATSGLASKQIRQPSLQTQFQPRKSHVLFEEDNTESIESHARNDITLAPIGSHLSFAAAANFASTPSNKAMPKLKDSKTTGDISFEEMDEGDGASSTGVKTENESNRSLTSGNTCHTGLSPIIEGSTEDSGSSSKSGHHTLLSQHAPELSIIESTPNTDLPEDTMSLLQIKPLSDANNSNTHVIDISAYNPPDIDEKTENFLSMSICMYDPKGPFDDEMKEKILSKLTVPLSSYQGYIELDDCLPEFKKGSSILCDMECYLIQCKIGEGGFAKVFLASVEEDMTFDLTQANRSKQYALKVQEPSQRWEFYICKEIHRRLAALHDPVDISMAMMDVRMGMFYRNGSCLFTNYQENGTLLDLTNLYSSMQNEEISQNMESVMAFMTIELLHMVENLHKCSIIHGDVKPDNFLFLGLPRLPNSKNAAEVFSGQKRFAQLIDFGQSVDMTKYKPGTTFMTKVTTQCFQCTEMKTNRPWTYQTDYFGLAGTIHVLVFKHYMNVYQTTGKEWKMTSSFHRHWNTGLWKKLFHMLLNVPSCDELPDLSVIRKEFEDYFVTNLLENYNSLCGVINQIVDEK